MLKRRKDFVQVVDIYTYIILIKVVFSFYHLCGINDVCFLVFSIDLDFSI